MYKTAMIGDKDSIYGFAAAGVEIYPAYTREETLDALRKLTESDDTAVIFITEAMFETVRAEVDRLSERPMPAIIPVPGVTGNTGIGKKSITDAVIRAVGSDIS